jgi:hypothetical protein
MDYGCVCLRRGVWKWVSVMSVRMSALDENQASANSRRR